MSWRDYGFREYVPVAQKKAQGVKHAAQVAKKQGRQPAPVELAGHKIATTFWGKAWNENLEAYSDYANRLPRGATYLRNGSVVDLVVKPRKIEAIVAGSETYTVSITIAGLKPKIWQQIKQDCATSIDSLLDLLAGRFSDGVMQRLTRQNEGLFPAPGEIQMKCSCPDYSDCCKHLAAVMYGVGARLDTQPELLFVLREVDHEELVSQAVAEGNLDRELRSGDGAQLDGDLGSIFGIELDSAAKSAAPPVRKTKAKAPSTTKSNTKPKAKTVSVQTAVPSPAAVVVTTTASKTVTKPTPAALKASAKTTTPVKKSAVTLKKPAAATRKRIPSALAKTSSAVPASVPATASKEAASTAKPKGRRVTAAPKKPEPAKARVKRPR